MTRNIYSLILVVLSNRLVFLHSDLVIKLSCTLKSLVFGYICCLFVLYRYSVAFALLSMVMFPIFTLLVSLSQWCIVVLYWHINILLYQLLDNIWVVLVDYLCISSPPQLLLSLTFYVKVTVPVIVFFVNGHRHITCNILIGNYYLYIIVISLII